MLTSRQVLLTAFASLIAAAPAMAVDILNRDKTDREAVVNHSNGQSEVVTVKAGKRVTDVCTSCVILVGDSSVEALGRATAVIEDGKITLGR